MRRVAPLPEEIHSALVRLLFTSLPPVILLSVATTLVGGILFVRSHDAWFLALTLFAAVLSVVRVLLIVAHNSAWQRRSPQERIWEAAYAVLSIAFGTTVGLIGARSFALDDLPAHVLALGLVLPYTAGLIGRVAVRPVICMSTILALMLPVTVAMAFREDVIYPTLAGLSCLYLSSGFEMTRHIYRTTVDRLLAQREIEHIANHDALTGLASRAHFRACLERALASMDGRAGRIAVMYIDLDRFKAINDTLGHHVGDILLRAVATRIRDVAGAESVVGRWGGDEFVLYAPVQRAAFAEDLAQRIAERLSAPYDIEGREIRTGASVGVAIASATHVEVDTLLKNADAALFAAKAEGRATWRLYDERVHRSALSWAA